MSGAPTKIANFLHKTVVSVFALSSLAFGVYVTGATMELLEKRKIRKLEEEQFIKEFIKNMEAKDQAAKDQSATKQIEETKK
ncbi:hypothetical protein DICPUDRAFT_27344 [Dictyostelium purpureum]|uniref:Uncharacterized protein n=1 Tax=Dictyostelium purpureum TaxID=5786 RepID=F0ZA25_DICPU|nr:uncharacterized protein DICPUDRAFT_27344 [Dictyostelium purpureum]EGC39249.1 hypothetical protein DICPUDRAFT_27344 [Dictyostelium purpureum]|eukprot:XP_003284276.1 hypothetical protein DICPUDRAFT_27344 [Dictyostelium purpureum]